MFKLLFHGGHFLAHAERHLERDPCFAREENLLPRRNDAFPVKARLPMLAAQPSKLLTERWLLHQDFQRLSKMSQRNHKAARIVMDGAALRRCDPRLTM